MQAELCRRAMKNFSGQATFLEMRGLDFQKGQVTSYSQLPSPPAHPTMCVSAMRRKDFNRDLHELNLSILMNREKEWSFLERRYMWYQIAQRTTYQLADSFQT